MASIVSIGTALPRFHYSRKEVSGVGERWLKDNSNLVELFDRFLSSSKTRGRNYCVPVEQVLGLNGMRSRSLLFEEHGTRLGVAAFNSMLTGSEIDKTEIQNFVFTSCSCPSIPAIDALILEQVGLPRTTLRMPVYQHGCAGGVVGLNLASKLSHSQGLVSLTSVELCSLVFQSKNPDGAQLVGAAIFADGAASVLVSPQEKGLVVRGAESYLVPDSRHLMGYNLMDDGFYLRLDRELPKALMHVAPERVNSFLSQHNTRPEEVSHWLIHPGGTKILDFLDAAFKLKPEQAHWSRDILSEIGNLSSATILFVLKAFLDSKVSKIGDKVLMLGVGPGLTLELILFEWIGYDSCQ